MAVLEGLVPRLVFYYFEEISKIPRGSGNEKAISDYITAFGKEKGYYTRQDEAYNVFIKKPGTKGCETAPAVILQGHMDMVCEKNMDTVHDFLQDPLSLVVEGDFIRAEGTTLGADNGVAVAFLLAVLADDTLEHPPIEAIFTTEEETGLKGAATFSAHDVEGRRLINLDSEEEGKLLMGCAGGQRAVLSLPMELLPAPSGVVPYVFKITGLLGGHSGSDIHLERASANILMGRVLGRLLEEGVMVSSLGGGLFDNAIAREAKGIFLFPEEKKTSIEACIKELQETIRYEYRYSDPDILFILTPSSEKVSEVMGTETVEKIVDILTLMPWGVQHKSFSMEGLIETSNNLGVFSREGDNMVFHCALRSSVASRKEALHQKIVRLGRVVGATVTATAGYPGWEFNPDSRLLALCKEAYMDVAKKEPSVEAIHAGLECGLFGEKIPGLDMISFGPDHFNVHTPMERLSISSTARVWDFFKEVLRRLANRGC